MNNSLSIIIPVLNNFPYTKYCLDNLLTLNSNYEIIVVDNASNDETEKNIENLSKNTNILKYIRNEKNLGFAGAVNKGYKISSKQNVMFLNNDIKFNNIDIKSWFDNICNTISNNDNGIFGPTGGYVNPYDNFNFVYETNNTIKKINYMSGWCLAANKNVWNKLILKNEEGPFDSKNFFVYYEDTDLGFRCIINKISFNFIQTPIVHIGKQTSKNLNISKLYLESREKFIKKWQNQKHMF